MGPSTISFLSFRRIFHWTMIMGEMVAVLWSTCHSNTKTSQTTKTKTKEAHSPKQSRKCHWTVPIAGICSPSVFLTHGSCCDYSTRHSAKESGATWCRERSICFFRHITAALQIVRNKHQKILLPPWYSSPRALDKVVNLPDPWSHWKWLHYGSLVKTHPCILKHSPMGTASSMLRSTRLGIPSTCCRKRCMGFTMKV